MGFMSHGQKHTEIRPEQKWDYITLNDFKSTSCFAPLAYVYLYFSLALSIAVYAVDTFTAVNLLVFNKWSSEIAPTQLISFDVSKWIFSICIILSFVNLAYEHLRAQRIMNRGSVAECYLDNLAVRLESIRWGKGLGYKRFLVFAELTKSKKGAEYIALFTYFSFQAWIRIIICSGPRQAVNALTLLSVYKAELAVSGDNVGNTLLNFFDKIRTLAEHNYQEALILSGMIFTLVIWVFSVLALLLALAFFLFFLWGYIPREDGNLSIYCSRKINKRLMTIVAHKVNTAIQEEERRRKKAEFKAAKKAGELPPTELTATIPDVGPDNKLPSMPMLNRNDTMTTLPAYTSRPGTAGSFELNALDQKTSSMSNVASMPPVRPMPSRTGTSFSARAPLLGNAADPAMTGRSTSPTPSIPTIPDVGGNNNGNNPYGAPLTRTGTAASNRSFGGPGGPPPPFPPLNRTNTGRSMPYPNSNSRNGSFSSNAYTASPAMYSSESMSNRPNMPQMPQPIRSPVGYGNRPSTAASSYSNSNGNGNGRNGSMSGPQEFGHNPSNSTSSSRYGPNSLGAAASSPRIIGSGMLSPMRSATNPMPISPRTVALNGLPRGPGVGPPQRNMTAPMPSMNSPMGGPMGGPTGGSMGPYSNSSGYHERQISTESSYSSYFERPSTASNQRGPQTPQGPPRRPSYGSGWGNNWTSDVESQRGGTRY